VTLVARASLLDRGLEAYAARIRGYPTRQPMRGDPQAIRRFFTFFTILGLVVVIGGVYAITTHRTGAGIDGIVVGGCVVALSEWLGWRLSRRRP